MFLNNRSAELAVAEGILESLAARDAKMCDTWDRNAALGVAYALKAQLSLDEVAEVSSYMKSVSGSTIIIGDNVKVEIVKGDVKERNDKATLIMRYKHIEGF